MLVIDEAHTFFAEVKGDKELMALAAENPRSVEELVKEGALGRHRHPARPQKSTGDAIPTAGAGTRAARSLHQAKHLLDS